MYAHCTALTLVRCLPEPKLFVAVVVFLEVYGSRSNTMIYQAIRIEKHPVGLCAYLIPFEMLLSAGSFAHTGWVVDCGDGPQPEPASKGSMGCVLIAPRVFALCLTEVFDTVLQVSA